MISEDNLFVRLLNYINNNQALYGAACAPVSSDTIINDLSVLDPTDLNPEAALEELKYLKGLSTSGFDLFLSTLDKIDLDNPISSQSPELCLTLLTASAFCKRMTNLCRNLSVLCLSAADKIVADPASIIKNLELRVQTGIPPELIDENSTLLRKSLDFTPGSVWGSLEVPLRNRVGFKNTTAVISDGTIKEEALKVTEFARKKQRNPTGFHKFTFKDLRLDDSDIESESRRSRGSSAREPAGSTDGGSTRGSLTGGINHGGALTSRSASSAAEDDTELERLEPNHHLFPLKSGSSVVFSCGHEREIIQDTLSDPLWDAQTRRQKRYSRIRNRVPTGHPSMMHGASDEMAVLVEGFERQISALQYDITTAQNTKLNKELKFGTENE